MKIRFTFLFVLLIGITISLATDTPRSHSQNKTKPTDFTLSDNERNLLNEINEARAHPQLYASYLEKLKPLFNGRRYTAAGHDPLTTEEGWNAVDDAIKSLNATKPLPSLVASRGLSQAALTHVQDQNATGGTGHKGSDSTLIEQRVKPFGRWEGAIGENIAYGSDSARERLLTWLIDDGFPSRGHRRRLMSPEYQVAGISCGAHPRWKAICVLTLAGGFIEFNPATAATTKSTSATKSSSSTKPANTSKSQNTKVKSRKM